MFCLSAAGPALAQGQDYFGRLAAASGRDRLVLCAPVLVRAAGAFESAFLAALAENSPRQTEREGAAFQLAYRAEAAQALAARLDRPLLDWSWQAATAATWPEGPEQAQLIGACVDAYNASRAAGLVDDTTEQTAVQAARLRLVEARTRLKLAP